MRFWIRVNYADAARHEKGWREEVNRPDIETEDEAREEAATIIKNFNDTLRPQERPRVLVGVEFADADAEEGVN